MTRWQLDRLLQSGQTLKLGVAFLLSVEVLPQHVGDDLFGRATLRLIVAAVRFGLGLIPLHDIIAQARRFGHFIQVLLLVERVDALVSLEGFAFGLQEVLAVGLHVIVVVPIAEALAGSDCHSALRHALCVLHPVTAIIIFSPPCQQRLWWGRRGK